MGLKIEDTFIGRNDEIAALKQLWNEAKVGKPQAVVIKAPSGFGKTRLIQEFYSCIAEDQDENHRYWPSEIDGSQYRGRINPEMNIYDSANLEVDETGRPPFLWWGLHLNAPERKTGLQSSSLSDSVAILLHHSLAYEFGLKLKAKMRELGIKAAKGSVSAVVDVALNLATAGLFSIISGIGKSVAETGLDMAQGEVDHGTPEIFLKERDTLARRIVKLMGAICKHPPNNLPAIPVCIVIDEAQWADGDKGLRRFVHELLQIAGKNNWPIMVIALTWSKEWDKEDKEKPTTDPEVNVGDKDIALSTLWQNPQRLGVAGVQFHSITLAKLTGMDALLQKSLPGLTATQSQTFLHRADGNPLFLQALTAHALEAKKFFENRDTNKALTEKGEEYFANVDYETMIAERLSGAPSNVQSVVGLGSTIGLQFPEELVVRMAIRLAIEEPLASLEAASVDYRFLVSTPNRHYEFRQNRYREVARNLLLMKEDEEELISIQSEIKTELLAKAAAGEIELSQIPLDMLARPELSNTNEILQWNYSLANIIYHATQRNDDTEFENLVSLFIEDGAVWLDALPLEECEDDLRYSNAILNIIWLIKGINQLSDPNVGRVFVEKLAERFLDQRWIQNSSTTPLWAACAQNIAELFLEIRSGPELKPELAKELLEGGLHYIQQTMMISPEDRTRNLKHRLELVRLSAYQRAGYKEDANEVFGNLQKEIAAKINEGLENQSCYDLRRIAYQLTDRGIYERNVIKDDEASVGLHSQAECFAIAATKTCGCEDAYIRLASVQENLLGHFTRTSNRQKSDNYYHNAVASLNKVQAKDKNSQSEVQSLLAKIEIMRAQIFCYGKQNFNLEQAEFHLERALQHAQTSITLKKVGFVEADKSLIMLLLGRIHYLQGNYTQWLKLGMPAIKHLQSNFGQSAVDFSTSHHWFDNAVKFALNQEDYDLAERLIRDTAALYSQFIHWINSPFTSLMAATMLVRRSQLISLRFEKKMGRPMTESEGYNVQANLPTEWGNFSNSVELKLEEFGLTADHVINYLSTGKIPEL